MPVKQSGTWWPTPPAEGSLAHGDWAAGLPPRYLPDGEPHPAWRIEQSYQDALTALRRRHGVEGAQDTGPATMAEVEAARAVYGNPESHEAWVAAVEAVERINRRALS